MDSVHTWKMELTEFPEELGVRTKRTRDGGTIQWDRDDHGVTRSERKIRSSALDIYTRDTSYCANIIYLYLLAYSLLRPTPRISHLRTDHT